MIGFKMSSTFALDRKLKSMPVKIARGIQRKAARRAAKPVLAAARANMPAKSGQLKKSLKIRSYKSRKKGIYGVRVMTGKKWFKGDQFYAAFVEFGTRFQAPKHPLKRAAQSTKSVAQKILVEELRLLIREATRGK